MTRRINQKLAVKRRKEEQEEELKAAKKMDKKERQPKPLSECEVIENEMNTKLS